MKTVHTYIPMLACALVLNAGPAANAQRMTLDEVISAARERSVSALAAKSTFISSYWEYRSYQASRLPSLNLYGNLASFDRSLRQLRNYETGELV